MSGMTNSAGVRDEKAGSTDEKDLSNVTISPPVTGSIVFSNSETEHVSVKKLKGLIGVLANLIINPKEAPLLDLSSELKKQSEALRDNLATFIPENSDVHVKNISLSNEDSLEILDSKTNDVIVKQSKEKIITITEEHFAAPKINTSVPKILTEQHSKFKHDFVTESLVALKIHASTIDDKNETVNAAIEKLQTLLKELGEAEKTIQTCQGTPPLSKEIQDKLVEAHLKYYNKRDEFLYQHSLLKQELLRKQERILLNEQYATSDNKLFVPKSSTTPLITDTKDTSATKIDTINNLVKRANVLIPFIKEITTRVVATANKVNQEIYSDREAVEKELINLFERHETEQKPLLAAKQTAAEELNECKKAHERRLQSLPANLENPKNLNDELEKLKSLVDSLLTDHPDDKSLIAFLHKFKQEVENHRKELFEIEKEIMACQGTPPLPAGLQDKLTRLHCEYQNTRITLTRKHSSFIQDLSEKLSQKQQSLLATQKFHGSSTSSPRINNISKALEIIYEIHKIPAPINKDIYPNFETVKKERESLIERYKQEQKTAEEKLKKYQEAQQQNLKEHGNRLQALDAQLTRTCGPVKDGDDLRQKLVLFKSLHKILTDQNEKDEDLLKQVRAESYILANQIHAAYRNGATGVPKNLEEAAEFATYLFILSGSFQADDPLWSIWHQTNLLTAIRLNILRSYKTGIDVAHKTFPLISLIFDVGSIGIYLAELAVEGRDASNGVTQVDFDRTKRIGNAGIWTIINGIGNFVAAIGPVVSTALTAIGYFFFDLAIEIKQYFVETKACEEVLKKAETELAKIETKLRPLDQLDALKNERLKYEAKLEKPENDSRDRQAYSGILKNIDSQIYTHIHTTEYLNALEIRNNPNHESALSNKRKYYNTLIPKIKERTSEIKWQRAKVIGVTSAYCAGGTLSVIGTALGGAKGIVGILAFAGGAIGTGGILILAAAALIATVSICWAGYKFYKWMNSKSDAQTLAEKNKNALVVAPTTSAEKLAQLSVAPAPVVAPTTAGTIDTKHTISASTIAGVVPNGSATTTSELVTVRQSAVSRLSNTTQPSGPTITITPPSPSDATTTNPSPVPPLSPATADTQEEQECSLKRNSLSVSVRSIRSTRSSTDSDNSATSSPNSDSRTLSVDSVPPSPMITPPDVKSSASPISGTVPTTPTLLKEDKVSALLTRFNSPIASDVTAPGCMGSPNKYALEETTAADKNKSRESFNYSRKKTLSTITDIATMPTEQSTDTLGETSKHFSASDIHVPKISTAVVSITPVNELRH